MSQSVSQISPEEVVFRTNSDSKSIILVFPHKLVYASEGSWGGYIIKTRELLGIENPEQIDPAVLSITVTNMINQARAFFVEPNTVKSCSGIDSCDEEIKQLVKRAIQPLPEEVREKLLGGGFGSYYRLYEYNYVEVDIRVKKIHQHYVVLDFAPKQNPLRVKANALRIEVHTGRGTSELVKSWKFKYPENPYVQRNIYAHDRWVYYKYVVEAPRELIPSVAPATTTPTTQTTPPATTTTTTTTSTTREAIAIRGFLVLSQLPSKALLDAHLPELFKGIKIGSKQVKLVMGYFYNKLGTLSRKFYTEILPRYAIDAGFGYIVPVDKAPLFLREVDELKEEYSVYEKQLKDFLLHGIIPPELEANKRVKLYREYLDIVIEYLREHGSEHVFREKVEKLDITSRVRISLLPFTIDYSIIHEYIDEKVRERVEREIREVSSEIIEATRKHIEEKVKTLLEKVERMGIEKLTSERVKQEIEDIIKDAEKLGINTEPLRKLLVAIENPVEFAKVAMELKASSERVKALIKSLEG